MMRPDRVNQATTRLVVMLTVVSVGWLAAPGTPVQGQDELQQRREYVAGLSTSERQSLLRKKDRFDRLTLEEKQRIRELHEQIAQSAAADELLAVVNRYGEWLKTLTPGQRAELLKATREDRVRQIRELKRRFEERRFGQFTRIPREDARQIFDWLDEFVAGQEEQLKAQLPDDVGRWLSRISDDKSRRMFLMHSLVRHKGPDSLPQPSEADIDRLVAKLSPAARSEIATKSDLAAKQALVGRWIHEAFLSRARPPDVDDAELQKFFEEELTAEERERLERLPRERLRDELQRRYFFSRNFDRRRRFGDGRPGPGGRGFRPPRRGGRDGGDRHDGDRERGRGRPRGERPDDGPGREDLDGDERASPTSGGQQRADEKRNVRSGDSPDETSTSGPTG